MRGKLLIGIILSMHCVLFVEIHSARMGFHYGYSGQVLLAPADFRIQDHIIHEWEWTSVMFYLAHHDPYRGLLSRAAFD